jgi:sulfatase modifying factor 1
MGVRCRGGQDGLKYPRGNQITPADANFADSQLHTTSPVKEYPPNNWGLYDMAGNVSEWVQDWFDPWYHRISVDDPLGPDNGTGRVIRGGSFLVPAKGLLASSREWDQPVSRNASIGFRCVRDAAP